jgi:hypothetical protein
MNKTKPYAISKKVVYEAFLRVKANKGSAGIDEESIEEFELNLKDNPINYGIECLQEVTFHQLLKL